MDAAPPHPPRAGLKTSKQTQTLLAVRYRPEKPLEKHMRIKSCRRLRRGFCGDCFQPSVTAESSAPLSFVEKGMGLLPDH